MTASEPATAAHRFDSIPMAAPDAILGISEAFAADARAEKMNLSVGVYKDAQGVTPVMKCVKAAEQKLLETEQTKSYLPIDGLPDYRHAVREMLLGDEFPADRAAVVQTPGGTGALRVAGDFLATQCAPTRVFLPNPTWANHSAIMRAAGLGVETYSYLGADRRSLDFEAMIADLSEKTRPGDAVLLHACCHNPTGVDPTAAQWQQIANLLATRGLIPLLDFAYQGFGDGLEADAAGLRTVLEHCDEAIVCSSYSKNFGLYSERVGAVTLIAGSPAATATALSQLKIVVRANYSNPPRHGGSIVATVLADPELTRMWKAELEEYRLRITRLRELFVAGMKEQPGAPDFSFLLNQKGMFSYSGLTAMQADELRTQHGVYVVGSGRINVAGINEQKVDWLCRAVADVM
ncbi:amino acid aminotransferase [Allorhodopirellula heiligendammensis]|uniref:Aspartate aminotransferase n=1 Tax=Allorhodopirellula heiligendammensis TaxID=2714739 RepID=A0A5C6BUI3_9BACT|nr:amino acid aminotransferase [Allorhodopirellula heiligendammensis]TWU15307.1 Aspartate aminotransferase [Allorhodopirellula heiligendammensis]|tara:strand:- start:402 stop:1619 length:1218 start_codon:yes stop_codon:yes gene_type:complete